MVGKLLLFLASALAAYSQSLPERFVVIGDTRGASSGSPINNTILQELATEIVNQQPSFVLVTGDLVYAGSLANFQAWRSILAPVYNSGIKVYPVMGNHDANDPTSFISVFGADLPDNGPSGEVNRTFFVLHNNLLLVGLDELKTAYRVNQTWLNAVLATNQMPHVFTFGHDPAFKVNHADCLDDYPANRDAFWNSLKSAGSRVYFCGHDHFHDRLLVNNGVYQVIAGNGGAPLTTSSVVYDGNNTTWTLTPLSHYAQYGYTVVDIFNDTVNVTSYARTLPGFYTETDVWSYSISPPRPSPANDLHAVIR